MAIEKRIFEVLRDDGWCPVLMKDMRDGDKIRAYEFDKTIIEGYYRLVDRPRLMKIQEHLLPYEEQNWGIQVVPLDPMTLKEIPIP